MAEKTQPLTEAHQALLEKRGISPELAVRLGWQSCANRKGDWVAIPFYRAGKVVNHKYRRIVKHETEQNFSQDKGGEQCFYNLAAIEEVSAMPLEDQRTTAIVITEGEPDCLTALACGYLAVSVPAGAPGESIEDADSVKYDFLKDFPRHSIAILAVDGDAAGMALRQDLALRLGWHRCKWVQYPRGCKDLNEVFQQFGRRGVDEVLKNRAKFMNEGGLFRMSELPTQPDLPAYECGIGNVSHMIKPRPGDMVVVTGIPSMGKTLFTNCMVSNLAKDHGLNACIGSFEQSPRTDHLRYLRTHYLAKPQFTAGGYSNWTEAELAEADAWIDKRFSFIVPDPNSDDMITLKWVLTRVRAAITQFDARVIVIDPWNELDHDRPGGMSLTEYTGFAIKELKRVAKQYMVIVIVVAHPSKLEKTKTGGIPIPTLYDISDSAHWNNKCDIGVVVHRLEGEVEGTYGTLIRVAKIRHWGVIGKTGDRMLEYLPERGNYIDAPDFRPKRNRPEAESKSAVKPKKEKEEPKQGRLLDE